MGRIICSIKCGQEDMESLFVILGLMIGALALVQLPAAFPDRPWIFYPAVAVPISLLFFGSVLSHELGHLVVAIFNLLPGLSLDGGWVLHAIVWRVRGSYHRAMQFALQSGSILASGMIGLGVFVLIGSQSLHGLWLMVVGTFMLIGSSTDPTLLSLSKLLQDMTVVQVMHRELPRIGGDDARQMVARRRSCCRLCSSWTIQPC